MKWHQMNSKISVLIPAAGQGKRMKTSVKKPYLLFRPINQFCPIQLIGLNRTSVIDEIIVIVDEFRYYDV